MQTATLDPEQPHLNRQNRFGKYQRPITWTVMLVFYQLPLVVSVALFMYGLIFAEYYILSGFIFMVIAQYPASRSQTYINLINNYINPLLYFNSFKRIFEEPIPHQKQNCMFAFHPHSVFAYGLLANMNYHNNDPLSRMVGLGSRFILNMPVTGFLLRLWGMQSVDPESLRTLMQKGQNVGLLPGGFQQATLTSRKQMRIFIENRKGFIKYALKYNYTLYPTIILNQHQAFWTFDKFLRLRMLINKIKIPGVFFFHPKTLLFYPPDVEFITVVGKGLNGRKYSPEEEPTIQEIEEMHKLYIKELKRIYDKHKQKNGGKPLVMY